MKIKFTLILLLLTATATFTKAQQLNIGTYNLRYSNQGDSTAGNGWGQRFPMGGKVHPVSGPGYIWHTGSKISPANRTNR
jgi:hypothetical protein